MEQSSNYNMEEEIPKLDYSLKEMGKGIQGKIPKMIVGKNLQPLNDPLVDKMKRWLLIGLSVLVAGGALIMIIASVMRKVF